MTFPRLQGYNGNTRIYWKQLIEIIVVLKKKCALGHGGHKKIPHGFTQFNIMRP